MLSVTTSFHHHILLPITIYLFVLLCAVPKWALQWLDSESVSNAPSGSLGNINGMHPASVDVMVITSRNFTENKSKPHMCCSALSWHGPTLPAEGLGAPRGPADTSLIHFLDALCLEAFPPLFLLLLVILVTFLKSPCSRWSGVSLEGKMQDLCNLTL